MSSPSSSKRAASPSGISPAPKRSHTTASNGMSTNATNNDEESSISSVAMHSRAIAEFFPEHYAANNGRISPRLPSEMTEEQQLAVAVARFRPLDGPLPPGFDVETLPVYRAPISHPGMTVNDLPARPVATPEYAEAAIAAVNDAVPGAVVDPIAEAPTPRTQTCYWVGCSKTFPGFNGPTLLWLHLTNEHVARPLVDPDCKWVNCAYSNKTRRFLLSHVGVHVPEYRPFVCDECGTGFKQETHLARHQKTVCAKE